MRSRSPNVLIDAHAAVDERLLVHRVGKQVHLGHLDAGLVGRVIGIGQRRKQVLEPVGRFIDELAVDPPCFDDTGKDGASQCEVLPRVGAT